MDNLLKVQRQLERALKTNRLEVYKLCIKQRLHQTLYNYNRELNYKISRVESNIDAYWERKERKYM